MHRYQHPTGVIVEWDTQDNDLRCTDANGNHLLCRHGLTYDYWLHHIRDVFLSLKEEYLDEIREEPSLDTPFLCNFAGDYELADRPDAIPLPLAPCQGIENKDLVYEILSMALDQAVQLAPSDQAEVIYRYTGCRVPPEYALAALQELERDTFAPLCWIPGLEEYALQLHPDPLARYVSEACYVLNLDLDVSDVLEEVRPRFRGDVRLYPELRVLALIDVVNEYHEEEGLPEVTSEGRWLLEVLARM